MESNNKLSTPLFTVFKRTEISKKKTIIVRTISILLSIIISLIIALLVIGSKNKGVTIIDLVSTLFKGAFILPDRLLLITALYVAFGVAVIPAFKMKFWNMGANGQVLIGALCAMLLMFYLGDFGAASKFNNFLLILMMFIASLIGSILWAVIPAFFKAEFKTNETLFTLMMNYIAIELVSYLNNIMTQGNQETPGIVNSKTEAGWLTTLFNNEYILPIIIIVIITVVITIYMNKTKHGFEAIVLGDSEPTAKYVGMNTKKITIRTMILSGAICGVIGFLYVSAIDHSLSTETGGYGFTSVLLAWLSNFNTVVMSLLAFLLAFLESGTSKISSVYRVGNDYLSSVAIGLVFFSILISEFFIRYKLKLNVKLDDNSKIKKFFNKFKKNNNGKETK